MYGEKSLQTDKTVSNVTSLLADLCGMVDKQVCSCCESDMPVLGAAALHVTCICELGGRCV